MPARLIDLSTLHSCTATLTGLLQTILACSRRAGSGQLGSAGHGCGLRTLGLHRCGLCGNDLQRCCSWSVLPPVACTGKLRHSPLSAIQRPIESPCCHPLSCWGSEAADAQRTHLLAALLPFCCASGLDSLQLHVDDQLNKLSTSCLGTLI